jgi:hypothetical protein
MIKISIIGSNIAKSDFVDKSTEAEMKYEHWLKIVIDEVVIYDDWIVTIEFFRQFDKWYIDEFTRRQTFEYQSLDSETIMLSIISIDSDNWKFDNPNINIDFLKTGNKQCSKLYFRLKQKIFELIG